MQTHDVPADIPVIEVADDTDARRVRRPNREACAANAIDFPKLRTEFVINPAIRTLAQQIQVEITERCRKAIAVLNF